MLTSIHEPCDESVIRSRPASAPCSKFAGRWVLVATTLASSMAFIDSTVVNVALPALQTNLNATIVDVQWVIEAYSLLLSALLLVGGSLGDHYGRRRVFLIGVALFALASTWCGLAPNIDQLIVARAAQGLGAALLVPGSLAIISSSFPENERGRAIGTWSGFSAITTAIGPVIGGWLIEHLSWRAIFFINVPIAILIIFISLWRVPESSDKESKRLDWLGAILITFGLGALVYGLIESSRLGFGDRSVLAALIAAAILLAAFLIIEARLPNPMLPLALFRSRTFTGANLLTFLLYGALGRLPVLSSAQSDSSPALLGHCSWRGFPPVYLDHLSSFSLGRRARRKVRIENPAGYRPVNCSFWLCAFYVARFERRLLANIFPCSRCARNRHGRQCRASDHDGDEFSRTESCRHCIRREQRSCKGSRTAGDRCPWNRYAPLL